MKTNIYANTTKELATNLETNLEKGLTSYEAEKRLLKYGKNELQEPPKRSLFMRFIDQMKDFMVIILIFASILSFTMAIITGEMGEVFEGLIIIAIVLINALLGIVQESKAEKALENIKKLSTPHVTVIRDGKEEVIDVDKIVLGDIVRLHAGDYVPADLRIIESINLKTDESALTGEPIPIEKTTDELVDMPIPLGDQTNMAFMGTVVTYGRGTAIVVKTAMNTEIGKIAQMLTETEESQTPLQKNIAELGKTLAIIALAITGFIFLITIIESLLINQTVDADTILDALMTSVALAVAAIPEGLPAIITIVLAIGMQNLAKHKAIMKKLPAVETLGSTSIICSDKTGTLTQNKMTITKSYVNNELIDNEKLNLKNNTIDKLIKFGVLCNDTIIQVNDNNEHVKVGDPTEISLFDFAINLDFDINKILNNHKRIFELPFDSERKLMTTVNTFENKTYAIVKGAPDVVLGRVKYIEENGNIVPANQKLLDKYLTANNQMADQALRVLAIAYKEVNPNNLKENKDTLEHDLILVGLVGMIDPPRPEVYDAIKLTKKAGITTIMITGDHLNTAKAIASDLKILGDLDLAITGHQLDKMDDEEYLSKLRDIKVYARVSPENKVRIVKAWKSLGLVVAMTGDGVNDAPSIKQADIGISMGITGTEVAKGAADMVLTDDNFATIVDAVGEGRTIFSNIKKAIHFLLSCNIGEILTIFLGTTLGFFIFGESVTTLTAVQILWVNLVTDSLMAIGLGLELREPDVMDYPPRDSKDTVFSDGLGKTILLQGMMIGLITFVAYIIGYFQHYDASLPNASIVAQDYAQTLTFMVLALSQLVHAFNVRSRRHSIFKLKINKFLILAFFASLSLQLLTVVFPFTRSLFGIEMPNFYEWMIIIGLSLIPLVVVESTKLFNNIRREKKNKTI